MSTYQSKGLTWSKEIPTEEGWYWFRPLTPLYKTRHAQVLEVYQEDNQGLCLRCTGVTLSAEHITTEFQGEWAGPIELPVENDN